MDRQFIEHATGEQIDLIRNKLKVFNREQTDYQKCNSYVIQYVNANKIVGGISFDIRANWMDINFLFVERIDRNNGLGSKILLDAENTAKTLGCNKAFLNTFGFQAKPFYEKHGYIVVYVQTFSSEKSNRYYMEKSLL